MECVPPEDERASEVERVGNLLDGAQGKVRRAGWFLAVGVVMMCAAQAGVAVTKNRWGCAIVLMALAVGAAGIIVARLWQ